MYHEALSVAKLALLAALVGRVALLAALPGRESVRTARPEGVRVADEGRATLYMAYSPRDGVEVELCITRFVTVVALASRAPFYVHAATLVGHSLHLQNGQ